ncbi:hypothetical protein, partial [Escherichia coli]|uniref:hypothetical protein n=1 Tax=Escherichia coli TaxID=562 RepID=UPI00321B209F
IGFTTDAKPRSPNLSLLLSLLALMEVVVLALKQVLALEVYVCVLSGNTIFPISLFFPTFFEVVVLLHSSGGYILS